MAIAQKRHKFKLWKQYSRNKKNWKDRKKSKLGRPSKGLAQSEYKFRRQKTYKLIFGGTLADAPGWEQATDVNWAIYKNHVFTATGNITGWSEFQQLFQQYKIDGVRIQMYPDMNTLTSARTTPQLIMLTIGTQHGYAPSTMSALLNHQALKKQILFQQNQPLDIYMKLRQSSAIYSTNSSGNPQYTDYTSVKPKFIASEEDEANHYGISTYVQTANQTPMTTNNGATWTATAVTVYETIYFTCKGVA